jgi:hypothetical protein
MLTHQEVADALQCSRQMAAKHIARGCPRSSAEAALDWYHRNIRVRADRKRPNAPRSACVGPAYNSRILEVMDDACACIELDSDLRELPALIANDPSFFPSIANNQVVRRHVDALHEKWFGPR